MTAALVAAVALAFVAAPPPARVQVAATEFDFALSRQSVKTGRVIVQLANFGEDPHDLRLRRIAPQARTYGTKLVLPEQHANLTLRLAPGRYRLWCSVADHRARGMSALLTVRR